MDTNTTHTVNGVLLKVILLCYEVMMICFNIRMDTLVVFLDVRVPKVVTVSFVCCVTIVCASSTTPSKYVPLGAKLSAQGGILSAIASLHKIDQLSSQQKRAR